MLRFGIAIMTAAVGVAPCDARSVVVKGTTLPPDFTVPTAQWSPKCPNSHVAFNHGRHCCSDPMRTPECPQYTDGRHLHENDTLECCSDASPLTCPKSECFSNGYPFVVRSLTCPAEHPTTIDGGIQCCAYKTRSSVCPTGPEGSLIEAEDPVECCHDHNVVPCFNQKEQWSYCESVVCKSRMILSHDGYYIDDVFASGYYFGPKNIFHETCERGYGDKYYLLENGASNVGFILDMGCVQSIKELQIKNTINSFPGMRATDRFKIEVSLDLSTWYEILNDKLTNSLGQPCENVPVESFWISTKLSGRFLRFTVLSFHGYGGGLNYLTWKPY